MKHLGVAIALVLPACLAACEPRPQSESAGQSVGVAGQAQHQQVWSIDDRFAQEVLDVAAAYQSWGRVSDEAYWAPFLCREPSTEKLLTRSNDAGTHGQKLYYLYARDSSAYLYPFVTYWVKPASAASEFVQPSVIQADSTLGQAVVKQSWVAEVIEADVDQDRPDGGVVFGRDGKRYRPGDPGPLFVMLKKDPATPGTDQGWVYATLTPDGRTITGLGRMESCMACHTKAPNDRMFGIKVD